MNKPVARFLGRVRADYVDKDWQELVRTLIFYSAILGRLVKVPRGFRSDGRSVPRWLPVAYMLYGGRNSPGAWVHDWFYASGEVERDVADAVFREALLAEGERPSAAAVMYVGVRIGGWASYKKRPQSIPIDPSPGA